MDVDKLTNTAHHATAPRTSRRGPRRRLVGMIAALSALALVGAACSDDDDTTETGAEADTGGDGGGEVAITIATPADGAEVGDSFDVELESDTEFGEPDTGLHHVHLYYDGRSDDSADYVIANADHSLTEASDEVTVTVGDDAGGGGGGVDDTTTTTNADGDDPYSY